MIEKSSQAIIRIWDFWIRSFHWCLAASVIFLLISGETGFQFFEWHRNVGEFVLLLVLFRIVWGIAGSSNAKLHTLVSHPRSAFNHLVHLLRGNTQQERGHNAAGGWAVLAMLLLIGFQAISGLFIADEDELIEGAFYGALGSDLSEQLLHLHHLNAELLLILVGVHVLMVFVYLFRAKQNLIIPMITGRMRWTQQLAVPEVRLAPAWLGFVLALVCLGVVGFSLGWFAF